MNPDDRKALAELDADISAAPFDRARSKSHTIPWLIRLCKELDARVQELEAGGIPAVIAKKDAELAARDAQQAKLAEQLAKLEREKLPDPNEFFRRTERMPEDNEKPAKNDR